MSALELQKVVSSRQQLETQKKESEIVKEELDYLEDGTNVYKLVGPALIKQELAEAKATVLKRLEYIGGEMSDRDRLKSLLLKILKNFFLTVNASKRRSKMLTRDFILIEKK